MNKQTLRIAVVVLAVITALIHFSLLAAGFDPLFFLNGVGYLALAFAFYTGIPLGPLRHRLVTYLFIAYTLVTILAWVAVGARDTVAYVDKVVEVLLVICLALSLRD